MKIRPTLPLKTYCEIFSFLPFDYVFLVNWTCLMLYRVSQCIYRPLQRPLQRRIIEQLRIVITKNRLQFQFADVTLRLLEGELAEENSSMGEGAQRFTYSRRAQGNSPFQQWEIERKNAHICWPTTPFPSRFMPNIAASSDIIDIERISVELVHLNSAYIPNYSANNADYSCTICNSWSARCVIFFSNWRSLGQIKIDENKSTSIMQNKIQISILRVIFASDKCLTKNETYEFLTLTLRLNIVLGQTMVVTIDLGPVFLFI